MLLINAAKDEYVQPMRKNLGMKNVLVSDYGRSEIGRIYHAFETCDNAKLMDIPITVFESTIFDAVYEVEKSP